MDIESIKERSRNFRIGWWVLFGLALLSLINHLALVFFIPGEEVLFWGWAGFNAYALVVLLFPYRKLEAWAWIFTWVFAAPNALIFLYDSAIGPYYFGLAVLITISQLLTRGDFMRK